MTKFNIFLVLVLVVTLNQFSKADSMFTDPYRLLASNSTDVLDCTACATDNTNRMCTLDRTTDETYCCASNDTVTECGGFRSDYECSNDGGYPDQAQYTFSAQKTRVIEVTRYSPSMLRLHLQ